MSNKVTSLDLLEEIKEFSRKFLPVIDSKDENFIVFSHFFNGNSKTIVYKIDNVSEGERAKTVENFAIAHSSPAIGYDLNRARAVIEEAEVFASPINRMTHINNGISQMGCYFMPNNSPK